MNGMLRWFRRYGCSVALVAIGTLWFLAFCVRYIALYGVPEVRVPVSTPYTAALTVAGVGAIAFGVWLPWLVRRGARRRRQQSSKRPRAGRGARGKAVAPRHGGRGATATLIVILPSPAGYPAGRRRAGQGALPPPGAPGRPTPSVRPHVRRGACVDGPVAAPVLRGAGAATHDSRRRLAGDRQRRAVAALAREPAAATTHQLPADRAETWTWPGAPNAEPRNEINR